MKPTGIKVDLTTELCGIKFPNPFVLASGPPTAYGSIIKRAFALGWGGAVTKTLKPDKLNIVDATPRFATLKGNHGKNIGFENIELISKRPLDVWLKEIRDIKKQFPDNILIGSIMAQVHKEDWQNLAIAVQDAGVDALELNFSCPHGMPEKGMGAAIGQVPKLTKCITAWVKEVAKVPVIVKLTPNVTDITIIGQAAMDGGADGLAAINTIQCLMGIDLDTFAPLPTVDGYSTYGGYSGMAVKPVGLRIVSQLGKSIPLPICGIGGISSWVDAVEYMLLGASNVQICTEVMLKGYGIINQLVKDLENYLHKKGFSSLKDITGLSLNYLTTHEQLNKCKSLAVGVKRDLCVGCGKCVTVCQDAGSSALKLDGKKTLIVNHEQCDGCSLCTHVCPRKALALHPYRK